VQTSGGMKLSILYLLSQHNILYIITTCVCVRACVRPSDATVPRFNGPAEPARTVGQFRAGSVFCGGTGGGQQGGARTNTRVLFFFFFPPFSGGLPRVNTRVGAGQGRVGAGQGRASRAVKINSKK
jgi:hypothetical protein